MKTPSFRNASALVALMTVVGCQPATTSPPTAAECSQLLAANRADKKEIANFIERARVEIDARAAGQASVQDPLGDSLATCVNGLKLKLEVNQ